jgi:tRNA threonylcarbamoyladenosine biosynthesis protein TsaE
MANRNEEFEPLWGPDGVVCHAVEDTIRLGVWLASEIGTGSVVSLEGPLGAGKTQLTKGLVAGLGSPDAVTSPSFALVHEYSGGEITVFHFDFYRMESAAELDTTGYDDCLAAGITIIEWGNKFPEVLPPGTIRIRVEILPGGGRRIRAERL